MYVFTHLLHTGTVVLSVASQRVFLIILLPGPHGFHALLFFFFVSIEFLSYHLWLRQIYPRKQKEFYSCSLDLDSVFKPLWFYEESEGKMCITAALDYCIWWHNMVPFRGTPSTSHLMLVSLALFSKIYFLSPMVSDTALRLAGPRCSCSAGGSSGVSPCVGIDFSPPPS